MLHFTSRSFWLFFAVVAFSNSAIGVNSKLFFANSSAVSPFITGGIAAHRLEVRDTKATASNDPLVDEFEDDTSDVEGQLGVDIGIGTDIHMKDNVFIRGELAYRNILEDTAEFDQVNVGSSLIYQM